MCAEPNSGFRKSAFLLSPVGVAQPAFSRMRLGRACTGLRRRLAQRGRVGFPRPAGELLGIVIETIRHPPVGGQGVLTILGGVAERAQPLLLESRDRFAVRLKVD